MPAQEGNRYSTKTGFGTISIFNFERLWSVCLCLCLSLLVGFFFLGRQVKLLRPLMDEQKPALLSLRVNNTSVFHKSISINTGAAVSSYRTAIVSFFFHLLASHCVASFSQ